MEKKLEIKRRMRYKEILKKKKQLYIAKKQKWKQKNNHSKVEVSDTAEKI